VSRAHHEKQAHVFMKVAPFVIREARKIANEWNARCNREQDENQNGRNRDPSDPNTGAALISRRNNNEMHNDDQQSENIDILVDDVHAVEAAEIGFEEARLVGKKNSAGP